MSEPNRPTRVTAITASAQLGGTERVLYELAERLFEFDIALRVLCPRTGPLMEMLKEIGIPAEAVPAPGALLKSSQRAGHLWTVPAGLAGVANWSRKLKAHDLWQTADVIYTVAFKAHLATVLGRRHPIVWHQHEFPPARTGWMWRLLASAVPDSMIVNSEAVGKGWDKGASRRKPSRVLLYGINLDRFKPREPTKWIHRRLGIPTERRLVGMPAIFARWKGQPEVIEAFNLIRDEVPDVDLVFVGGSIYDTVAEAEYGSELEQLIREEGGGRSKSKGTDTHRPAGAEPTPDRDRTTPYSLPPRIHLLPFQDEIESVYPEFDLVIHYSLRPEPFGRVILESMACGVPVVAADEGGPREVLGGGIGPRKEAGWLVNPRDPAALAAIMTSALRLPTPVLHSVGAAARIRAEQQFSSRRFAGDVAAVLHSAAGRMRPAAG